MPSSDGPAPIARSLTLPGNAIDRTEGEEDGGEGRESNPPRTLRPPRLILKTSGTTGHLPSPRRICASYMARGSGLVRLS